MNVKYKSKQNAKAANLLLQNSTEDNDFYMAVIHCVYYSCFQLIKFILKSECKYKMSYYEQNQKNEDSHEKIIKKLIPNLKEIVNTTELNNFRDSYYSLKRLRIKADYNNQKVNLIDVNSAIEELENIKSILNKI